MENKIKSVTELRQNDICFIENGDRSTTGIIQVDSINETKSGKFTTIWFYLIEQSDLGFLGTSAGVNAKHPKYGQLYYICKSNKYQVELISE